MLEEQNQSDYNDNQEGQGQLEEKETPHFEDTDDIVDKVNLSSLNQEEEISHLEFEKKIEELMQDDNDTDSFRHFSLPQNMVHTLDQLQFKSPTPVQSQVIPLVLEKKDILASSQTGTGKTGAFGIPIIARLLDNPNDSALVVTPTRELANQVIKSMRSFIPRKSSVKTALIIGGESMLKQIHAIKARPRLIVGTPGRINDLLERRSLKLQSFNILVLDETDRMLDMGFSIQIDQIIKHLPQQRQTLLFSATLPPHILRLAKKYLYDATRISIGSTVQPIDSIQQEMMEVKENDKSEQLMLQIDQREGSIIVFVRTKYGTEKLAKHLKRSNIQAHALHGDLRHNKRERVIKGFRTQKYKVLVATDIASRGIDVPHVQHVINYDLPQCPEDYIHRIGRTGRAGSTGEALSFVSSRDAEKWDDICQLMNPELRKNKKKTKGKKKDSYFKKKKSRSGDENRRSSQGRSFRSGDENRRSGQGRSFRSGDENRRSGQERDFRSGDENRRSGQGRDFRSGDENRRSGQGRSFRSGDENRRSGQGRGFRSGDENRRSGQERDFRSGDENRRSGQGRSFRSGDENRRSGQGRGSRSGDENRRSGQGRGSRSGDENRRSGQGRSSRSGDENRRSGQGRGSRSGDENRRSGQGRGSRSGSEGKRFNKAKRGKGTEKS